MKVPFDYHLHTNRTDDGNNTLLEIAERAAAIGLEEIAITDHYVARIPGYCITERDAEQHFRDAETAAARHGVKVLIGIEADYIPAFITDVEKFIAQFDFDYVLGSAHFVDGCIMPDETSARLFFSKHTPTECYTMYFRHLKEAAGSGLFDVMAHLDIVRRFGSTAVAGEPLFEEYAGLAAEVAGELKRTGTGFEVNCRGFDHGPAEQYPSAAFLRMLRGQGVDNVTIGSDAHWLDAIGAYLDRGVAALCAAGFTHLCRFRKRAAERVEIAPA